MPVPVHCIRIATIRTLLFVQHSVRNVSSKCTRTSTLVPAPEWIVITFSSGHFCSCSPVFFPFVRLLLVLTRPRVLCALSSAGWQKRLNGSATHPSLNICREANGSATQPPTGDLSTAFCFDQRCLGKGPPYLRALPVSAVAAASVRGNASARANYQYCVSDFILLRNILRFIVHPHLVSALRLDGCHCRANSPSDDHCKAPSKRCQYP